MPTLLWSPGLSPC